LEYRVLIENEYHRLLATPKLKIIGGYMTLPKTATLINSIVSVSGISKVFYVVAVKEDSDKKRTVIKNPAASERGMKNLNRATYVYSRIRNLTDEAPLAAGNQTLSRLRDLRDYFCDEVLVFLNKSRKAVAHHFLKQAFISKQFRQQKLSNILLVCSMLLGALHCSLMNVSWKLPQYLKAHKLSVSKLDKELSGKVSTRTLYAWGRGAPERPDLANLGLVIGALRRLTGQPVTPNDLLEVIETPEPQGMDEETKEWLEASADDMHKAIRAIEKDVPPEELSRWHESMQSAGKPAKYVVGKGIVLLEGKA
jgi:hypothetical protein